MESSGALKMGASQIPSKAPGAEGGMGFNVSETLYHVLVAYGECLSHNATVYG
jgi:hypothetical protein